MKTASKPEGRLHRFLRRLWSWFVVYCMASLVLSFIPEMPLEVEVLGEPERLSVSGELLAGAARAGITPPETMWKTLNLYGEAPPIRGVLEEVHARALTLGVSGADGAVSLVSVELLVIPPAMRPAVRRELTARGLAHVHLVLSATHTHTGPGNFWDVPFARFYMGKYSGEYFDFIVRRTVDAVEASVKGMRPARIGFGSARTRHLVKHRRLRDPVSALRPPVDEGLEVMRVEAKTTGEVIAWALNLGAHPTTLLRATDRRLAGDYPGAVSRLLEETHPGAVGLFLQGAAGSVRATSPRPYRNYRNIAQDGRARVAMQADMLLAAVREAETRMTFEDRLDLATAFVTVALPAPDAHFFPEERPYTAVRVLTLIPNWLMNLAVDVVGLPEHASFQAVRLGRAYLLTFPCDLSNRLGWDLKRHVRRDHVMVLGVSNDYALGYTLAREEYDLGGVASLAGSERVQCFYGKRAGPLCVKVAGMLANMVREEDADDVMLYRPGDGPGKLPRTARP